MAQSEIGLAEWGDFSHVTTETLAAEMPNVTFLGGSEASGKAAEISLLATPQSIVMSARAGPEDCAYIRDDLVSGVGVEQVTVRTEVPCAAANAPAAGWAQGLGGGMGGGATVGGLAPGDGYPVDPDDPAYYGEYESYPGLDG